MNCKLFKSILCLNGRLSAISALVNYEHCHIVAADGAYLTLLDMNIQPNIIIGDMDSVGQLEIPKSIEQHLHYDQNKTDFEKSLEWIKNFDLFPCLILGMFGGEADHIFHNMNIFVNSAQQGMAVSLFDIHEYGRPQYGYPLLSSVELKTKVHSTLSILPYPKLLISSQGLKWELITHQLSIPDYTSARNHTIQPIVKLDVHSGTGILLSSSPCHIII